MAPRIMKQKNITISTRSPHQLGQAIERYRTRTSLTQASLAKSAGLRQATISKTEKGVGTTEIRTIYAICAALNLEIVLRPRQGKDDEISLEELFSNDKT